jgi:hypothetical protein
VLDKAWKLELDYAVARRTFKANNGVNRKSKVEQMSLCYWILKQIFCVFLQNLETVLFYLS